MIRTRCRGRIHRLVNCNGQEDSGKRHQATHPCCRVLFTGLTLARVDTWLIDGWKILVWGSCITADVKEVSSPQSVTKKSAIFVHLLTKCKTMTNMCHPEQQAC
jgi:hypothetical protein